MSIWENKKQILQGISNTLLKQQVVETIAAARQGICDTCPNKSTECAALISTCCSLCGCSLKWKTRSLESSCPDNRWPAIIEE